MGSKKILEEMYNLIIQESKEYVDENGFYKSVLSNIKIKTPEGVSGVLEELLRIVKTKNQQIGEISNGVFVCFPEIIKKTEEIVINKLENQDKTFTEKEDLNIDSESQIKNESTYINDLINRYNELSDEEFSSLWDNIGQMSDEQFLTFNDAIEKDSSFLVDRGIKSKEDLENDTRRRKLTRYAESGKEDVAYLAKLILAIENDEESDISRKYLLMMLEKEYHEKKSIESFQKIFKEFDVEKLLSEIPETERKTKIIDDSNSMIINNNKVNESYKKSKEFTKEKDLIERSLKKVYEEFEIRIALGETIDINEVYKRLDFDKYNEEDILSLSKQSSIYDAEQLKMVMVRAYRHKTYTLKRGRLKSVVGEENISKIVKKQKDENREENDEQDSLETKKQKGKRNINISKKFVGKKLKAVKCENSTERNNFEKIKKQSRIDKPIQSNEMNVFFNKNIDTIHIEDKGKTIIQSNNQAFDNDRKNITIEEPRDKSLERQDLSGNLIEFLKNNGSQKGLDEAANMIFGLAMNKNALILEEINDRKSIDSPEQQDIGEESGKSEEEK